jgi:ribonuclease J
MATQIYKGMTIEETDTVVLSARIIPGNERAISKLIGFIYKKGANIIEEKRRLIHVSGHASQEDIRIMTEATRPKFVVPIHGEYRMLFRHKEFVKNHLGYPETESFSSKMAMCWNSTANAPRLLISATSNAPSSTIPVFEEIEYETVSRAEKDGLRRIMITLVMTINGQTAETAGPPQIVAHGRARARDLERDDEGC